MLLFAEISTLGSVLLLVVGGVLAIKIGGRLLCCFGRLLPLTVLGAVAVIGGLALFGTHSQDEDVYVDRAVDAESQGLDEDDHSFTVRLGLRPWKHLENVDWHDYRERHLSAAPQRWVVITLGTILIISGALLAGRGKTRPVAVKAFTVLGIAAIVFSVVSFFSSAPRLVPSSPTSISSTARPHGLAARAREVAAEARESAAEMREAIASVREDRASSNHADRATKAKRPTRAKRPGGRDAQRTGDDSLDELPPRAAEIPVAAELNKSAPALAPPAAEPAPADAPKTAEAAPPAAAEQTPAPPVAVPATPVAAPAEPVVVPSVTPVIVPATPAAAPAAAPAEALLVANKPVEPAQTQASAAPVAETPAERPAWVDAPARLVNSVYSLPIASGPFATVPECQRELDRRLKHEADRYIDDYMGERASQVVNIPLDYLKRQVKKAEYNELIVSESVGPMHQIHALLEFDDAARADFHHLRHDAIVTSRLWYAGSGAALVLALLSTFYGYLKLDLRSGGAHKGRLQLAATLVALIVAAGALLVRWAVPF